MATWLELLQELLMSDQAADELMLTSSGALVLLSAGQHRSLPERLAFSDRAELLFALQEFALSQGLRLDPFSPSAGGFLLAKGLRWHCLIPPASPEGPVFILRRHRFGELQLSSFVIAPHQQGQLAELMTQRASLLLCGPTGSGKTSLLALLLREYAACERVVMLEDYAELPLTGAAWLRLVARQESVDGKGLLSFAELLMIAMRLRPDRLVLGELRGEQLREYTAALNCGHNGTLATLHAASAAQVEQRFAAAVGPGWRQTAVGEQALLWCVFLARAPRPELSAITPLSYHPA